MFEAEGDSRAVVTPSVKTPFCLKVASKIRTENVLVPQDCRSRRLAKLPIHIAASLDAIDIRPVEVLAKGRVVYQLEVIEGTIPENLWCEVELSLRLSADARHQTLVALVLVGIVGAVERVGSVALPREAELPIDPQSIVLIVALIVELSLLPATIEGTAVASAATATEAIAKTFVHKR